MQRGGRSLKTQVRVRGLGEGILGTDSESGGGSRGGSDAGESRAPGLLGPHALFWPTARPEPSFLPCQPQGLSPQRPLPALPMSLPASSPALTLEAQDPSLCVWLSSSALAKCDERRTASPGEAHGLGLRAGSAVRTQTVQDTRTVRGSRGWRWPSASVGPELPNVFF